jgi:hypothetical protein
LHAFEDEARNIMILAIIIILNSNMKSTVIFIVTVIVWLYCTFFRTTYYQLQIVHDRIADYFMIVDAMASVTN